MQTLFCRHLPSSGCVRGSLVLAVLVTCLSGCGSKYDSTAVGIVTVNGTPVSPGLVTFVPEDPSAVPSISNLDSNGKFELKTNKLPGLPPGKYRASVQAFRPPDVPEGQRSFEPSEPLVPEKYLQVTTSGLEFTVEPGSNTIDIELSSK
ncbi:hypothetical protein [Bythopirellula polymerisocia]|uniref:Carboxypeptidase regulatory-like domain-containing protein n=1 Tax=Bythopirellula polymerisocia TaxID=2528003 RepID=A0A5C6CXZ6_9BACT|nr:hypothetical protein [Bythopirellula polymerisocia]TWU28361.1 hypothetical protein Pla144_16490 [Bythopirellula polymerisocia]